MCNSAYMRAAVVPATPADFPWVQYNTWFAHLVDYDETLLRREAELAARLGAEVFVIDAGWWAPSLRTSDNFTTGLGVWQPSPEKFPSGIPAFADYVRGLGMRFGIWVEPERVDLRQPGDLASRLAGALQRCHRVATLAAGHGERLALLWPSRCTGVGDRLDQPPGCRGGGGLAQVGFQLVGRLHLRQSRAQRHRR